MILIAHIRSSSTLARGRATRVRSHSTPGTRLCWWCWPRSSLAEPADSCAQACAEPPTQASSRVTHSRSPRKVLKPGFGRPDYAANDTPRHRGTEPDPSICSQALRGCGRATALRAGPVLGRSSVPLCLGVSLLGGTRSTRSFRICAVTSGACGWQGDGGYL
jgi:hypothetical protein